MSKTITNLALPLAVEEIESVLESQSYQLYRQAYATPELRQRLIAFVLNSVPACYAMVEKGSEDECIPTPESIPRSLRRNLRAAIVEGIGRIAEENSDWVSHHVPKELNASYAPSDWFG